MASITFFIYKKAHRNTLRFLPFHLPLAESRVVENAPLIILSCAILANFSLPTQAHIHTHFQNESRNKWW